jgi:hypothetical protein
VPTLIAAEFPILAIEATLRGADVVHDRRSLGLRWWVAIASVAVIATLSAALRALRPRC